MKQLVIADRRIDGDKVIRDEVLSTMNGYVTAFTVHREATNGHTVSLDAEVTVSESEIANFIRAEGSGEARIDGDALVAQYQQQELALTSRSSMFRHLLDGFPEEAYDVKIISIQPSQNNPGHLQVTVDMKLNKSFLDQLKHGMNVLSKEPKAFKLASNGWSQPQREGGDRRLPHYDLCLEPTASCWQVMDLKPGSMWHQDGGIYNYDWMTFAYSFSNEPQVSTSMAFTKGFEQPHCESCIQYGNPLFHFSDHTISLNTDSHSFVFYMPIGAIPVDAKTLRVTPKFFARGGVLIDLASAR